MPRIICPFCLKSHDFSRSLACTEHPEDSVPIAYVNEYNQAPPLWLALVGFSGVGKTCYLDALALTLEKISPIWRGMFYRLLDQYTIDTVRLMHVQAASVRPAKATTGPADVKPPRPLLIQVNKIPEAGSRCLVIYDTAGEVFGSLAETEQYMTAVLNRVSTTWFLVSLQDLKKDASGKTLMDLFNTYLTSTERLGIDLTDRNLIVVYAKADHETFTPEIKRYLQSDPYNGLTVPDTNFGDLMPFNFKDYMNEMGQISDLLEAYTHAQVDQGAAFISIVKNKGINLKFSLCSALGQDIRSESGQAQSHFRRYRVLDPFLWAISLERAYVATPIGMILDSAPESQFIYDDKFLSTLKDRLSDYGDITCYYLGQARAVSAPGLKLPPFPRFARSRLVGPVLDHEMSDQWRPFIIITAGKIHDLNDFGGSRWRDQIFVVNLIEELEQDWPHQMQYQSGDDVAIIANLLMDLKLRGTDHA